MYQIPETIRPFYELPQTLQQKMALVDDMADELGEMLDWHLSVDFQIFEKDGQVELYAISIVAGDSDDEDAPVLFTTATVDETLVKLQIYLTVMEKLGISSLPQSQEHYESCLRALEQYYNDQCQDVLEQQMLENFFQFNEKLAE
ncbi:MAG: hypothetical protein ACO2ZM_07940 [Francisellaceae bacterium]